VVRHGFSLEERRKGKDLEPIEQAVNSVAIPAQLEPVAKLVKAFPAFAPAYAAALKRMEADPRSFGAVNFGFAQEVVNLSKTLQGAGLSTLPLADAFRTYLTKHLQGELCAETAGLEGAAIMRQMAEKFFNGALLPTTGAKEMMPIAVGELEPRSVGERATMTDAWQDGRGREIMALYKALRFGTKEQQDEYNKREPRKDNMAHFLPEELRRTPAWEAQAWEFLNELDRWNKNHTEPEPDFFHQLSMQYSALMNIVPSGPLLDTVFQTYLAFLKSSPMQLESPPEWLVPVRGLFNLTDATPSHREWIRSEIRRNGNLTMSLYAGLAQFEPQR
jgi:hypothetical protein